MIADSFDRIATENAHDHGLGPGPGGGISAEAAGGCGQAPWAWSSGLGVAKWPECEQVVQVGRAQVVSEWG